MKKMKLISSLTTLGVVAGAIPVVATACDSGDKVNSDYEIVCDTLGTTTADQNKTLVLQPGQVANFSMRYKGSDMTEQERKLILWTVNITRADNSNFKLVFADNLLNSPGSGCLYLPYTSADFLSPNEVVNFEVSAYDTVTANLLQRKSYSLSKARKTYSPTVTNGGAPDNNYALSLLNTMQFTSTGFNDTTKSVTLGLVCDDNTTPVSSVLWEIDTSLTISSVLNCVTLNKDSGVLTATIPADKQVVGYIVVSASFTDSENNSVKIFFISGISVGPYGIESNKPIN